MVTRQELIEQSKAKRLMNVAVILGSLFLAITFFNWGFIKHDEGKIKSIIFLSIAILLNGIVLLVYRQMIRDWEKAAKVGQENKN